MIRARAARTASARVGGFFCAVGDLAGCCVSPFVSFFSFPARGIVGSICVAAVGLCDGGCIPIGPVLSGRDGFLGMIFNARASFSFAGGRPGDPGTYRQATPPRVGSRPKDDKGRTPLRGNFTLKRDYYAGGLMLLLGVGAAVTGAGYKFGSLARMGPGFMPVVLGVVLAFLGLLIAGTALGSSEPEEGRFLPDNPQWFGWLCIIGGPILFIILGQYGGMIPAVFACVFVCALGDNTATYKSSAILAAGVTVFGVVLFHYLLSIPFPLLRGFNL